MIGTQETFEALSRFFFLSLFGGNIKKYLSSDDLIDYLIKKGVHISNREETLNKLEKYSYYSIVNTYKNIFKTEKNNYRLGVRFEEIYSLYEFDKKLRIILLNMIFELEILMKSMISELLSRKYGIDNYLNSKNFDTSIDSSIIINFINSLNNDINNQYGKHEAITHYVDKYGYVPPFVLVKILSFGEISKLYSILKQEDRQYISKKFNLSDKILKQILRVITIVRNICAHNERLYSFHSKFVISFNKIDLIYPKQKSTNLYMIIKSLRLFIDDKMYNEIMDEIREQLNILNKNLSSVNIDSILNRMGFIDFKLNDINY